MLRIIRKDGYYIDSMRPYKVFVDNRIAGQIWAGQEIILDLDEGVHNIRFKIDWCSSKTITFEIKSDCDIIEIECRPQAKPLTAFFYIIFKSRNYIAAEIKRNIRVTHPFFKYHPEPVKTGAFKINKPVKCDCCGTDTEIYYSEPFYSITDINFLCPECISSGKASEKYNGEFQDSASCDEVDDKEKLNELCRRTPGYCGCQQEYWLAHCNDYCAFVGYADWNKIQQLGIEKEIEEDLSGNKNGFNLTDMKKHLTDGDMQGYLFRCLHCGKHRLHIDFD